MLFDEGDVNTPPPPICKPINTKKAAQRKTKKLAKDEPKLTSAFKGFYTKYLFINYDINGDKISFIHKMNMKKPIVTISRYALDIEARMEELCEAYEAKIKADGNDTTKENYEYDVTNEIKNMGLELNDNRELMNHLKCVISEARDNQRRVESMRGTARRAADYWQPINAHNVLA